MMFWRLGGKGLVTKSMNHEGVCRTAPATPGMLNIEMEKQQSTSLHCTSLHYTAPHCTALKWNYLKLNFLLTEPFCILFLHTLRSCVPIASHFSVRYMFNEYLSFSTLYYLEHIWQAPLGYKECPAASILAWTRAAVSQFDGWTCQPSLDRNKMV